MVKSHFLSNEGSEYGSVIKFKKVSYLIIVYFILAMRLALGTILDRLKFIKPYCKKDVMV